MKTVKLGSKQSEVRILQEKLIIVGHSLHKIDGIFGSNTEKSVRDFQKKNNLKVDGVVGENTWRALESAAETEKITVKIKTIRKNSRGLLVKLAQEQLTAAGFPVKPHTEFFGSATDTAVRNFQRRNSLLADGIVGPNTWLALGVADSENPTTIPVNSLATLVVGFGGSIAALTKQALTSNELAKPVAQLKTSTKGLQFIYTREAWSGVSNRLHWPGGASGVTLGPGYDMKERSAVEIIRDMSMIGVTSSAAKGIAAAAGLKGVEAKEFCKTNRDLVSLSNKVEFKLMLLVVPKYERLAREKITVDLVQHEFDTLVSFAYNLGEVWRTIANHINAGKINDAMTRMKAANKSGGKVNDGLTKRRALEVALYTLGDYGTLRIV